MLYCFILSLSVDRSKRHVPVNESLTDADRLDLLNLLRLILSSKLLAWTKTGRSESKINKIFKWEIGRKTFGI